MSDKKGFDKHKWPYNIAFILLIVILTVFKLPDLNLPFFWDEIGVYVQAAYYQYQHGVSLMPASVPPEISRGHPLLFTFLNASILKVFGHMAALHVFCLFISICLVTLIYHKTSAYYGRLTGLLAACIFVVQPLFLAQSAMVLPEMTLALLITLSLTAYYEGKFLLFIICSTLALMVKESAVVVPVSVLCFSILQYLLTRKTRLRFWQMLCLLTPYLVFGIFLVIQKQQNGWYFFPYHIGSLKFEWAAFTTQWQLFLHFIFLEQGRMWLLPLLIVLLAAGILTNKINKQSLSNSYLTLALIFTFGFLLFCCLSIFYLPRYIMVLFVPISMFSAVAITSLSQNKGLVTVAIGIICFMAIINLQGKEFNYDSDMGFRTQVKVLQQAVDYLAENAKPNEKVYGNFPAYFALNFPPGGYLKKKKGDNYMTFNPRPDYFLLCNPGAATYIDPAKFQIDSLTNFGDNFARVTIYRLQNK